MNQSSDCIPSGTFDAQSGLVTEWVERIYRLYTEPVTAPELLARIHRDLYQMSGETRRHLLQCVSQRGSTRPEYARCVQIAFSPPAQRAHVPSGYSDRDNVHSSREQYEDEEERERDDRDYD